MTETVHTKFHGTIEVPVSDVVVFPEGLIGHSDMHRWVLLTDAGSRELYVLQSMDREDLFFTLTEPSQYVQNYQVPLSPSHKRKLHCEFLGDLHVFVVLNKVAGMLTANLRAPIVLNTTNLVALQLAIPDTAWSIRHPIPHLPGGIARTQLMPIQRNGVIDET